MAAQRIKSSLPPNPDLNRRVGTVQPLSRIVVYSEGKTETVYLKQFARHVGTRLFDIEFLGENGVPSTVVQRCIDRKRELEEISRQRNSSEFDKNFSVWAVFDRDEHPCYARAIKAAIQHGVHVAFSNPCCEIWAILHCQDYGDRPIHRHEAQRLLRSLMPEYDHDRNPLFHFEAMIAGYVTARGRAHNLLKSREIQDDIFGCPATNLVRLVEFLEYSSKSPIERSREIEKIRIKIRELEATREFLSGDPVASRERSILYDQLKRMK